MRVMAAGRAGDDRGAARDDAMNAALELFAALATAGAMQTPPAGRTDPPGQSSPPADAPRATSSGMPSQTQYLDADGNPLPPDVQRDIERSLRERPSARMPAAAPPAVPSTPVGTVADDDEVVVTGKRPRGAVTGDIPPERTFDTLDIGAYGAGNIGELLQALGPQVSGGGGGNAGPITLLNGRRVSNFSEIAQIPAEAIERMEVFPEQLALQYGYRADQKVVNIITREKFSSRLAQLATIVPTAGGYDNGRADADYFAIHGDTRFDFGATYYRSASLPESDRRLAQPGGGPDSGRFRSLVPATRQVTVNGLVSGRLLDTVSSTLNARYETTRRDSRLGSGTNGPLMRDADTHVAHVGTTLGGSVAKWLWTFTGNYDRTVADTATDIGAMPGVRDRARSVDAVANADLLASGSLFRLPAGPVAGAIRIGGDLRDFSSDSSRGGAVQRATLSRDRATIQGSVDVPIASRPQKALAPLGYLAANVNVAVETLSDFGTLRTFGYGVNWSPIGAISIVASITDQARAPALEQLGAPLVATPNIPSYDFARREAVDITRVFGGNPALRAEDRRTVRVAMSARPFAGRDVTFSLDYLGTRIDDPIADFPLATPRIEAAFPGRFTRDGDGRLRQIDGTPINFERAEQAQLRWGVSVVRPLDTVEPWMRSVPVRTYATEAEARAAVPPGTMVAMAAPGSAMARRFENLSSRLYVNLFYTLPLRDEIVVRRDLPRLDLLDGAATDPIGGTRRHRLEFQAGVFKKGLGARVTVNRRSGTTVRNTADDSGDLTFSSLATVNVNLFANLADRFGGGGVSPWLKGVRVTLGIDNLFNARPSVRDGTGATPLSYQPAYLDPIGRSVSLSLRKVF